MMMYNDGKQRWWQSAIGTPPRDDDNDDDDDDDDGDDNGNDKGQ